MRYQSAIQSASTDPQALEELFQTAQRQNETPEFRADLEACYHAAPDNLLYAAWYFRLQQPTAEPREKVRKNRNWILAVPLGILTGLIFWLLSDPGLVSASRVPYLFIIWAPIASLFAMVFLAVTAKKDYKRFLLVGIGLVMLSAYALLLSLGQRIEIQQTYLQLMMVHLPLLAWIGIGLAVMGLKSAVDTRFAFLIKSIEVMITAGLYLIAGIAFGAITSGMFAALSIQLPDLVVRLGIAGGFGLIPVIALASVYDPTVNPQEQDFSQGLSKFIATMMRLLLPLALVVLVIYICLIPFNFMQPFSNRDVLIVYNVMAFAILGLLIGVTPIRTEGISPRVQSALRNGILVLAILAALVSLYALSAVIYRTVFGGITINRTAIIGWNIINIALLILLVVKQFKAGRQAWVESLRWTFSIGTNAYLVWALFLIIAIPLIFR
jgi:hypothetical protein